MTTLYKMVIIIKMGAGMNVFCRDICQFDNFYIITNLENFLGVQDKEGLSYIYIFWHGFLQKELWQSLAHKMYIKKLWRERKVYMQDQFWPYLFISSVRQLCVLLWGKSLQKFHVNPRVLEDSVLRPTFFLLYINDILDGVICNGAIYGDDTALCSKCHLTSRS